MRTDLPGDYGMNLALGYLSPDEIARIDCELEGVRGIYLSDHHVLVVGPACGCRYKGLRALAWRLHDELRGGGTRDVQQPSSRHAVHAAGAAEWSE